MGGHCICQALCDSGNRLGLLTGTRLGQCWEPLSVTDITSRSFLALSSIFTLVYATVAICAIYACRDCAWSRGISLIPRQVWTEHLL